MRLRSSTTVTIRKLCSGMSEIQKWYILEMLNLLGHTFETDEEKLEGYALLSAMLPTYFGSSGTN